MKWAIELGEHDIEYCPQRAIKGQALADFLVESSPEEEPPNTLDELPATEVDPASTWKVYMDGSSTKGKCGAGVVLVSPKGMVLQHALSFDFDTTNNEAEYEALLVGLNIASRLRAEILIAHSNSQIIVNQIWESYQTKGANLKSYRNLVRQKIRAFKQIHIQHIPK